MSMIYVPTSNGYESLEAADILSKNRCIWIDGKIEGNLVIETISALLHFAKERFFSCSSTLCMVPFTICSPSSVW